MPDHINPNTALDVIRSAVDQWETEQGLNSTDIDALTTTLAALDQWLSAGGDLPKSWKSATR